MTVLAHEKPIFELSETIDQIKKQDGIFSKCEIEEMEHKLVKLKTSVYSKITPWERVSICRHPNRPHAIDYIKNCVDDFVEIFGDRTFQDDHAIIAGLGMIDGEKFMIIGQEKGSDTESRIHRNFGMPHPEGYRKAMRCMRLAAKFNLPILCLLDTPGAFPGLAAEERGQGWAISQNLFEMARLATPIIVLVIGEGCSGGALGMGVGDVIGMLEHSYYSVISPEGCASILWKDAQKKDLAASMLKMHVEDLIELQIVDEMIPEPMGGAHLNPQDVFANVKTFVKRQSNTLKKIPTDQLVENRYQKFRKIGKFEENKNVGHETSSQSCSSNLTAL